jgi:hypothetical protein
MNRFAIMRRDGFACKYCGAKASEGAKLHIDHIQPRSRGGTEHHLNLVTACAECNLSKGASEPEWEPCSPMLEEDGYGWHGWDERGCQSWYCSTEADEDCWAEFLKANGEMPEPKRETFGCL